MVLSANFQPYDNMVDTSESTWDSVKVDGCETIFYFGHPLKEYTENKIYLDIQEEYNNLGYKTLMAFDWALQNKEFDFISRINSSTYVNKKELIKYIQELPSENVFAGLKVAASKNNPEWLWGCNFTFSKDVIQKLVVNKNYLDKTLMEDVGISYLATKVGISFMQGKNCTIDKMPIGWRAMCYGSESFEFSNFEDIKKANGQFYFRCKQDYNREIDGFVMQELFKILK